MTNVKLDNILINYDESKNCFRDIKLTNCGNNTHVDFIVEKHMIEVIIFRSSETMFNFIWNLLTNIWFLKITTKSSLAILIDNFFYWFCKAYKSDMKKNWHIFKLLNMNSKNLTYFIEVLRKQNKCFEFFSLSYTSLANNDRLNTLTIITESIKKQTFFEITFFQKIAKKNQEFINKLMQLDLRNKLFVKNLLQDK